MSNKPVLGLRGANLATAFDPNFTDAGQPINPATKPFPWTCANRVCGGSFMRLPYHSEYCPKCQKHLKAGRGDLLDPVMYARCQAIIEQERAGEAAPEERVDPAARDKASGAAAWRALLGLPPLLSDFDVDAAEDFEGLNKVLGVVLTSHKKHGTGRKGR